MNKLTKQLINFYDKLENIDLHLFTLAVFTESVIIIFAFKLRNIPISPLNPIILSYTAIEILMIVYMLSMMYNVRKLKRQSLNIYTPNIN
jgi:hypothetical protein